MTKKMQSASKKETFGGRYTDVEKKHNKPPLPNKIKMPK